MARAYLKINVRTGAERAVKDILLNIKGVKSAEMTAGEQDIIAVIEAPTYDDLLTLVLNHLRPIDGIEKTVTNLVTEQ